MSKRRSGGNQKPQTSMPPETPCKMELRAGDISVPSPYEIMRQRNCKMATVRRREQYPSIRPPVSRCNPSQTMEWLTESLDQNGCTLPRRGEDALEIWQNSPHKDTLSCYGVGNPRYGPGASLFNKTLTRCLKQAGSSRWKKSGPKKSSGLPQPKKPGKPVPVCRPYVIDRQALKAELERIPTVQRKLRPNEVLGAQFCQMPIDPMDPLGVKEAREMVSLGKALDMMRPQVPPKHGLRRKNWYCTPKSNDEAFRRCFLDQAVVQPQQEPQNYEELYRRFQACFKPQPEPDPDCLALTQCCPEMCKGFGAGGAPWDSAPGDGGSGEFGEGNREGSLEQGKGDWKGDKGRWGSQADGGGDGAAGGGRGGGRGGGPGGAAGGGPGGAAGGGPGGAAGGGPGGDQSNEKGNQNKDKGEGKGKGKNRGEYDDEDDDKRKGKGKKNNKNDISGDDNQENRNKQQSSTDFTDPQADRDMPSFFFDRTLIPVPEETGAQKPGQKPKKGLKPHKRNKKKKKDKDGCDKNRDETDKCPRPMGCECSICESLYGKPVKDSPVMQTLMREKKERELRAYLRNMRHREYMNGGGGPKCKAPQHKVDPISCDDSFCRDPKLAEYCDCLGALQHLQQLLGKSCHPIVNNDLNDLRQRMAKRVCECIQV